MKKRETAKFMNKNRPHGGYSLVEVLVAITVLLIALVGPLTIAQSGLKRAINSREQTTSIFFSQEGLEAVVKLREDNALATYPDLDSLSTTWNYLTALSGRCTSANPCGVTIGDDGAITSSSFYNCNATNCVMRYISGARVPYKQGVVTGTASQYERKIAISVTDESAVVTSTVTWGTRPDQTVELRTYVYNIYTGATAANVGTPQTVPTQGDYIGETGPRGALRDDIEASCSNCDMADPNEDGSPNNDAVTRARVCVAMFGSGSTVESYVTGDYSSPGDNYIYIWNGSSWHLHVARDVGNSLIKSITCLTN